MTSPVTAVGRLLRPKHGEPRILLRVRRNPLTKRLHTVTLRILTDGSGTDAR